MTLFQEKKTIGKIITAIRRLKPFTNLLKYLKSRATKHFRKQFPKSATYEKQRSNTLLRCSQAPRLMSLIIQVRNSKKKSYFLESRILGGKAMQNATAVF